MKVLKFVLKRHFLLFVVFALVLGNLISSQEVWNATVNTSEVAVGQHHDHGQSIDISAFKSLSGHALPFIKVESEAEIDAKLFFIGFCYLLSFKCWRLYQNNAANLALRTAPIKEVRVPLYDLYCSRRDHIC